MANPPGTTIVKDYDGFWYNWELKNIGYVVPTEWAYYAHQMGWQVMTDTSLFPATTLTEKGLYKTPAGSIYAWDTSMEEWILKHQGFAGQRYKSEKAPEDLLATASNLEIMVYAYLVGKGEVFEFQAQLIGGFGNETGDAKVDFVLPEKMLAYRVQGEYWHTGTDVEAKDQLQKERLSAMGYQVVDLWQKDFELPGHFNDMMERALQGEEMPQ